MAATKRAAAQAAQRAMANGVGESRVFAQEDNRLAHASCTLNGQPIPSEVLHAIPYRMTDQGVAEFNAGKTEVRASVTRDNFDIVNDYNERVHETWEMVDAVGALKTHVKPGFRGRMLSPDKIKRQGQRGFEIVKDEKTGEPVRLGRMVLGQMPEAKARQRDRFFRDEAKDSISKKDEEIEEALNQIARNGGAADTLGAMGRGETLLTSDGERIEIGRHAERGAQPMEEQLVR